MMECTQTNSNFSEAYRVFERTIQEPNVNHIHISAEVLIQSGKQQKKDANKARRKRKILGNFQKIVSALRNSKGGCVLIHLCNRKDTNFNLSAFDEFADRSLKSLIGDVSLYTDVYKRKWLREYPKFEKYINIIVLTVSAGTGVATVEPNTKVGSDHEVVDPYFFELLTLLRKPDRTSQTELRGIASNALFESRSLQLKSFPEDQGSLLGDGKESELADFIWNTQRFKYYLSSFSKLYEGGSYYTGVAEAKASSNPTVKGIHFQGKEDKLKEEFEKKLESVVILSRDGAAQAGSSCENLIQIHLHPLSDSDNKVLEIAVRFVPGILFYDNGPKAYNIVSNDITKMTFSEWCERLMVLCRQ